MAKTTTLFPDWWKKGSLIDCIEWEEDLKDTRRNTQNAALNVDIF